MFRNIWKIFGCILVVFALLCVADRNVLATSDIVVDVQLDEALLKNSIDENLQDGELHIETLGLSPDNEGEVNSQILQYAIDYLSQFGGGTIYIPEGEYNFARLGRQTMGSHCIKMKSDITIVGAGESTILKPTGSTYGGLDMFYFNEYADTGKPVYLKNCTFKDFVIDGIDSSCRSYITAGKGFMFNLFENCHWENIVVKNTIATGFGVDCPIGGSMVNCTAINCGREANATSPGGAGFGIGFGYSEEESFLISDCKAYNNKTFGFFFEHQGRFIQERYTAKRAEGFKVKNCESIENYYNYGGLCAMNSEYTKCKSERSLSSGFYFRDSKNCSVKKSESRNETKYGLVVMRQNAVSNTRVTSDISFVDCVFLGSPCGAWITNFENEAMMRDISIERCRFSSIQDYAVVADGPIASLILKYNAAYPETVCISSTVEEVINKNNTWIE